VRELGIKSKAGIPARIEL